MGIQGNTKLLLLAVLIAIAIILTGILVPEILHERKRALHGRLFMQDQHIETLITVTQGDTVYLNASNNPCNYSSFWKYGDCELCGWNEYIQKQYHENKSCSPRFTCFNDTKGLTVHNVTFGDSGTYTEYIYECHLSCNTIDYNEYNMLDYFDNCTYNINSTKYIITVLSQRHSKYTNSHVATHVSWTAAIVTVIIISVLICFNLPATLRHRLRTLNVNWIT
ncbi:membrane protein UL1 [Human betaherpesvirus 5]|uniref:Membrane protein UL1 n=1 Tax=Human cytomegalovirus TaxID=10359 RepID=J7EHC5_HCMV|nr:membrane protein UL1 [Human betaherpesvirus 5]AKI12743.1 membrane protein UL1 [Human betaherpesvirus 5]AKI16088.1 membrane protein UL1 [Human betaherpesvirus 5]AKI25331.1 membrane protein UL1 [Human betaherpesvirus 5]AKI26173.1 membrane protein UL1 [Human betaherpesvirus 5]